MSSNNKKYLHSVSEVKDAISLGRTTIHQLIKDGKLTAKKFNTKTLITAESLHAFIESLPTIGGDK